MLPSLVFFGGWEGDVNLSRPWLNVSSTYPSLYVAFENIQATDLCGIVGSPIQNITTIGFDATELSTAASYAMSPEWYGDVRGNFMTDQTWWTYSSVDENWQDRYHSFFPLIQRHVK